MMVVVLHLSASLQPRDSGCCDNSFYCFILLFA